MGPYLAKPKKGERRALQKARQLALRASERHSGGSSDPLSTPKPKWLARGRKPLNRVGAVGRRYLAVRQEFLSRLMGAIDPVPMGQIVRRAVVCPGTGATGDNGPEIGTISIYWDSSTGRYSTDGHVHHIKKRSTHPELREVMSNLQLLCTYCHRKIHE